MAQDNFFKKITRLFRSGPSIRRRIKGKDYKAYYDGSLTRPNYGFHGMMPVGKERSPFSVLGAYGIMDRISRYSEFQEMEFCPEIGTALNVYADETCSSDEKGKAFHIYSENPEIKKQLEELFCDTLNIEFNLRAWVRNIPVKEDTPIPLLSGETIPIKELADRLTNNPTENIWVYSVQDRTNRILPGKVTWCGKNYTTNTITRVWLDDNTHVETALEHLFVLRDGRHVRADELTPGQSLMPFYTKQSTKSDCICGYEKAYNPETDCFVRSPEPGTASGHKVPSYFTKTKQTSGHKTLNHKVLKVETIQETCDVYCMTVVGPNGEDDRHNFAVCSRDNDGNYTRNGVFVANCKYGDFFLYLEVVPDVGIINVNPVPVNEIEREEGFDKEDPYSIRFKWLSRGNKILENWQIAHFRIVSNDLYLPYGSSVLDPARRIYRQLSMMEDAMLTYRIERSPERRVFYIDVGNIAPNDIPNYMEQAKSALRSNSITAAATGRQDLRYNPISISEDFWVPVRGEKNGTRIESLAGGQHVSATEDVEYLQRKLFAALNVPKAYIGFDDSLSSKSTLSQEDIKFSRTISIIQKIVIAELNKMAMLHLYAKGFDGEDLINFELFLSNPSSVAVQQKLALWNDRADIAGKFKEGGMVNEEWIQAQILGFNPDEISKMKHTRKEDMLYQKEMEAIAVSSENQERQATVDPFDQSNYQVPGAEGATSGNSVSGTPDNIDPNRQVSDEELTGNITRFDSEGQVIHVETPPGTGPIQATPYATRRRRNDKRRVGMGGRFNLQNPDYAKMLDMGGKNRQNTDPYDTEFLDRRHKQDEALEKALQRPPEVPYEVKKMFRNMDERWGRISNKKRVIAENLEEKLEEGMKEPLCLPKTSDEHSEKRDDFFAQLRVDILSDEDEVNREDSMNVDSVEDNQGAVEEEEVLALLSLDNSEETHKK